MRLFIAIEMSDAIKDELIRIQNRMYDSGVRGRYTTEDKFHLTLAFIGEFPAADPILDALSEVFFTPFDITLEGLGCFGDIWWAGIRDSAPLAALVRRLRRTLAVKDIPFDRKGFSPHITLIRQAAGTIPGLYPEAVSMTVSRISLMRSDRGRSGMIYTELGALEAL